MRYIYTSTIPSTRLVPRVSCVVEASIEVIDDLQGEAQEIAQAGNTFITYGPPMQLARVCTAPTEDLSSSCSHHHMHMSPPH